METRRSPAVVSFGTDNAIAALAPAFALAQQYAGTAHALTLEALQQASAQQNAAIAINSVTLAACTRILADAGATADASTQNLKTS